MLVFAKCRRLFIAAALAILFNATPAPAADCESGEISAECLAAITATAVKASPRAYHNLRMQALSALLRYHREKMTRSPMHIWTRFTVKASGAISTC